MHMTCYAHESSETTMPQQHTVHSLKFFRNYIYDIRKIKKMLKTNPSQIFL